MSIVNQQIKLDSEQDQHIGEVCIPNISGPERQKRLRFGVIAFTISLAILAILVLTGANRLWRLPLVLLFTAAATGYFQWHDKTCLALANRHTRKTTGELETIEDAGELAQIRRQANRVQFKAVVAAVALTVIALILPVMA